jgi:hypothetical protein
VGTGGELRPGDLAGRQLEQELASLALFEVDDHRGVCDSTLGALGVRPGGKA